MTDSVSPDPQPTPLRLPAWLREVGGLTLALMVVGLWFGSVLWLSNRIDAQGTELRQAIDAQTARTDAIYNLLIVRLPAPPTAPEIPHANSAAPTPTPAAGALSELQTSMWQRH